MRKTIASAAAAGALLAGIAPAAVPGAPPPAASPRGMPFTGPLTHVPEVASTVPGNSSLNPYGTAVVPDSRGGLTAGDVLVSNFNNAANQQGRGTTIVEVSPGGRPRLFAKIPADSVPGGAGLTTALVVLRSGWVIAGSLPTADGIAAAMKPGELFVLDSLGHLRETITGHGIDGPWDATALDSGGTADLFVSNVLNGIVNGQPASTRNGDVVRLTLALTGTMPKLAARWSWPRAAPRSPPATWTRTARWAAFCPGWRSQPIGARFISSTTTRTPSTSCADAGWRPRRRA